MDIERLERIEEKCDKILALLSEKHPKRPHPVRIGASPPDVVEFVKDIHVPGKSMMVAE